MCYISQLLGLGAHFARNGYNCIHCEVHSRDLHEIHPPISPHLRTLKRIYNHAHLLCPTDASPFPFTCDACNTTFIDLEVRPSNSIIVLFNCIFQSTECDNWQPTSKRLEDEYVKSHFGSSWHIAPVVDIEPTMQAPCCLHFLLSVTRTFWRHCILNEITTDRMANRVNTAVRNAGIYIRCDIIFTILKHPYVIASDATKVGTSASSVGVRSASFTGRDALRMWRKMETFLRIVFNSSDSLHHINASAPIEERKASLVGKTTQA